MEADRCDAMSSAKTQGGSKLCWLVPCDLLRESGEKQVKPYVPCVFESLGHQSAGETVSQ